jgi:hypothetical protein
MRLSEHYREAERLLAEGVEVVQKISELNTARKTAPEFHQSNPQRDRAALTRRMDELGKKAMGIWAQAQVHATLATAEAAGSSGRSHMSDTPISDLHKGDRS